MEGKKKEMGELSNQQKLIMEKAVLGLSNKEIAEILGLSEDTVETQIRRVNKKLATRNKFGSSLIINAELVANRAASETAKSIAATIAAQIRSFNS